MGQSRPPSVRIRLDFRDKTPIYEQIGRQVTEMVARGDLAPGDQLPTVRRLAEALGVNFNTVARSYRRLDQAGVISTQHGRGTFVVGPPRRSRRGRSQALGGLARDYLRATAALGFGDEAAVDAVRRQASKKSSG